jgi:protein-disulfide isomerase
VEVVEYSSFDCPACALFYENVMPELLDRVEAGEISFSYVPLFGTGSIANGQGAARAAVCAGEQDAFWTYHGALFTWQSTYGNQAFAGNRLRTGVTNLGLDMGEWDACFASDRPDEVLIAANGAANSLEGFTGTPTVTVNGQIVPATIVDINAAIDLALASAPPVPETPTEATEEASE